MYTNFYGPPLVSFNPIRRGLPYLRELRDYQSFGELSALAGGAAFLSLPRDELYYT